jgi:hypothetical protein
VPRPQGTVRQLRGRRQRSRRLKGLALSRARDPRARYPAASAAGEDDCARRSAGEHRLASAPRTTLCATNSLVISELNACSLSASSRADHDDIDEPLRVLRAATCLRCKTESSQGIPDPGLVITVDRCGPTWRSPGRSGRRSERYCPAQRLHVSKGHCGESWPNVPSE